MSLLKGLAPVVRVLPCKVKTTFDNLEPEDGQIFSEAVNDSNNWPAKTLSNALQARGVTISDLSITRHRTGTCSC